MRSGRVGVHIAMAMLVLGAFASAGPAAEPGSGTVAAPASAAATTEAPKTAPQVALVRVQLHTELGDIVLGLDPQHAPITSANFLSYVDQQRFDGSAFYRAVKLDEEGHSGLVQGGLRGDPERVLPPIAFSMARAEPGTATADFFIVMGDLPSLDGQPGSDDPGYAVFGHVLEGMDVVRKILERPRDPQAGDGDLKGQMIDNPVQILTVRRIN